MKKNVWFTFVGQKSLSAYFFTDEGLSKVEPFNPGLINGDTVAVYTAASRKWMIRPAGVSLNWLIDDECKVTTGYLGGDLTAARDTVSQN